MVFLRNPQVRYTPINRDGMKVAFSLEAPNAAIDTGKVSDVDPTLGVEGHGRKLAGFRRQAARLNGDWGQFQAAGSCARSVTRRPPLPSGNPSGSVTGWGLNLNGWLQHVRQGSDHWGSSSTATPSRAT